MTESSAILVNEKPILRTLVIDSEEVRFLGDEVEVRQMVPGRDHTLGTQIWNLERARKASSSKLDQALQKTGEELSKRYLVGAVADALADAVADAEALGLPLELGVRVEDPNLAKVPWETLRVPESQGSWGPPLSLHPNVFLYRSVKPRRGRVARIEIPRPLRILVAIGSPEAQNKRGELLDYEAELERILEAVEPARRNGDAHIRILQWGTVAAIHQALEEERYHVLYISCHAVPGKLILEDENGRTDRVHARRLVEHLPVGRRPPLVVLAGCATALSRDTETLPSADSPAEDQLPGLAEALLGRGVPSVLAMQAPVGDVYARRLGAQLFGSLATFEQKEPLRALTSVRQTLERKRRKEPDKRDRAEWATPALYLPELGPGDRASPILVSEAYGPKKEFKEVSEAIFPDGVVHRRRGFVGRRREERLARRVLLGDEFSGVLLHGLGGVGKSTFAAELLARLREDHLILSAYQKASADPFLDSIGAQLLEFARDTGLPEDDPLQKNGRFLRRHDEPWEDRFDQLANKVLPNHPILLLVDNFEDHLVELDKKWEIKDPHLAELLTRWLRRPGSSRVLFTSRHPFKLPKAAEKRLRRLHLGPLSYAETRKLFWRLPQLDALNQTQQMTAYSVLGGHPRTLEYLDALLSGGKARFPDVEEKLQEVLKREGCNPKEWLADTQGDLNRSLAQVVTVAVQDVVLDDLIRGIEDPLARTLLFRASVYRLPVDLEGLAWQVGSEREVKTIAEPSAQPKTVDEITRWIQQHDGEAPTDDFRLSGYERQVSDNLEAILSASAESTPADLAGAVNRLLELGLLAPAAEDQFIVHRWTAEALIRLDKAGDIGEGHRRAARYWRWRVEAQPLEQMEAIEQRLEALWHHRKVGETGEAVEVAEWVVSRLFTLGAYRWEAKLCREVLTWVPERSSKSAAFLLQLGNIAYSQGSYDEALSCYQTSVEIFEELGDRSGMASVYHQFGMVSEERGSYEEALQWYRRSLEIDQELGDRLGMAISYHQMGAVSEARGAYQEALAYYRKSLKIKEELGDQSGMAISYQQLGIVSQLRGAYDEALDWYQQAVTIKEEVGDRSGVGALYHQFGTVAEARESYDEALAWYRKSLEIAEELGDRSGMAISYHHLGIVAQALHSYDEARKWYRKSLEIEEELGHRLGQGASYHQLGVLSQEEGSYDEALSWYRRSAEIFEELGSLSGMASSYHQLGAVAVETGKPEVGVSWQLKSLGLSIQLESPEGSKALFALMVEEDLLGQDRFRAILEKHLDEEGRDNVLRLMDQFRQAQQEGETEAG